MAQLQLSLESLHPQRRAFWMRQLQQWHSISSALCLIGVLLFALTGITLDHARQIEASPQVIQRKLILPVSLRTAMGVEDVRKVALPAAMGAWLDRVDTGVAINVRGSFDGLLPGDDAVLHEVLGGQRVEHLREQGRYRRDV